MRRWWREGDWRSSRKTTHFLVCGAGLLVGIGVFSFLVMPLYVGSGNQVRVPDVVGEKLTVAQARLASSGLPVRKAIEESRSDVPSGVIVGVRPAPGTMVKEGRGVIISVSTGPAKVTVPVLSGEELPTASMALARVGLVKGRVARGYNESFSKGLVIATNPKAGQKVDKGSKVDLLVSLGKEPVSYVMPELRGTSISDVKKLLEPSGIYVLVRRMSSQDQVSEVLEQTPLPGAQITTGDTVEVVLGRR